MSRTTITRLVTEWVESPRTWHARLECGHVAYVYDEIPDETRDAIVAGGNKVACYECGGEADRISELEGELRELKKKRRTSPSGSEGE